jgi:ribosomal protein L40E
MERALRKPYLTTLLLPFLPKTDIDTRAETAASTYEDFMNADKRLALATSTRGYSLVTRTQHPSSSTTEKADADADKERESGEHASRVALEVCSRLHAKSPTLEAAHCRSCSVVLLRESEGGA